MYIYIYSYSILLLEVLCIWEHKTLPWPWIMATMNVVPSRPRPRPPSRQRSYYAALLPVALLVTVLLALLAVPVLVLSDAVSGANDDDAVTFTLYDNGSSQGGVEVTLLPGQFGGGGGEDEDVDAPSGEAFAVDMSSRVEVSKHRAPKPVIATRAFREDGELVTEFGQLRPPEGRAGEEVRRVYLVAEGLEFVWPYVALGHNQTVSPRVLPPAPGEGPVILESVGDRPRVFRVHNIATDEETSAIISAALNATGINALKRSTVGSGKNEDGEDEAHQDRGRTSDNAWDHESPAARTMITRSFQLTNIAEDSGKRDGLQIVRYHQGQGYNTHPDYFTPSSVDDDFDFYPYSGGSNRFATVFMYLNDPEEGGHTVFPRAPGTVPGATAPQHALDMFEANTWERTVVEECYTRLAVPPKRGTAALFYSITPDGQIDPSSHHAACPLLGGTKWGANIWIWNRQRYGEIRTGEARTVLMENMCDEDVYVSWEGQASSVIQVNDTISMGTFEHHRFKASFGSYKGEKFSDFTVQGSEETVTWTIKAPRRHGRAANSSGAAGASASRSEHAAGAASEGEVEDADGTSAVVQVSNESRETICVSWEGEMISELAPGAGSELTTFAGHVFAASTPSCDEEPFALFVAKAGSGQSWKVTIDHDGGIDGDSKVEEKGAKEEL